MATKSFRLSDHMYSKAKPNLRRQCDNPSSTAIKNNGNGRYFVLIRRHIPLMKTATFLVLVSAALMVSIIAGSPEHQRVPSVSSIEPVPRLLASFQIESLANR